MYSESHVSYIITCNGCLGCNIFVACHMCHSGHESFVYRTHCTYYSYFCMKVEVAGDNAHMAVDSNDLAGHGVFHFAKHLYEKNSAVVL